MNICKRHGKQLEAAGATTEVIYRHSESTRFPYLFCGEQGLVRYWHIGNKRNANAIVARTEEKNKSRQLNTTTTTTRQKGERLLQCGSFLYVQGGRYSPAVQMVKTTCTESKKKNMTSRDTEAPMGRNRACVESIV